MSILDNIVEQKKLEVARLPERVLAAGDLRDALLERGERRDFLAALRQPRHGDCMPRQRAVPACLNAAKGATFSQRCATPRTVDIA